MDTAPINPITDMEYLPEVHNDDEPELILSMGVDGCGYDRLSVPYPY